MPDIAYCKIHPGVGIARLGDSPDQYFIGPESPGHPGDPAGAYKDALGRVKRQAARFRIYAYDRDGNVLGELTAANATIRWTVHLANRKAAAPHFQDRFETGEAPMRNSTVQDRSTLVIDPGARSIEGSGQSGPDFRFDGGRCFGVAVPLGELRTDAEGRLLVLGGYGHSHSPSGADISTYANNDGWYDDASDGPVTATVVLPDGTQVADVRGAWVIAAPPKFAPAHQSIVTLYDVIRQVALDQKWLAPYAEVSFTRDIYPILARAAAYQWLNATAYRGHGAAPDGNFASQRFLDKLSDASADAAAMRQAIFSRLREPGKLDPAQANFYYMPQLSGDGGDATDGDPKTWLTVTPEQYEAMRRWAAGDFVADWAGAPAFAALEQIPLQAQPGALDRAALEYCIGGPFYPGIEMTYIALDPALYAEPFRLADARQPGDITQHMAVPWQADFYQCNTYWWPAARPDDVVTEETGDMRPWARGLSDQYPDPDYLHRRTGDSDLVRFWSQLGFVVPRPAPEGVSYVESERRPYAGLDTRDCFYRMLNLSAYPDFRAKARELAELFLAGARAQGEAPDPARLDLVLDELLARNDDYDPAADPEFRSRQDVVELIRQLAPLHQTSYAWLRQCLKGGPVDQVHGLLFRIWQEANGGGQTEQSLANLYTTLLRSVDLDLPAVDSQAYTQNQDLLESAFTLPLFGLCLSEFTESYLPELLGFTLGAAWRSANLQQEVALLRHYRIDAHFFTASQGLSNLIQGHTAMARQAVQAYLDEVRAVGGEAAAQAAWRRIWTGFVGYRTASELKLDLQYLLDGRRKPDLEAQLEALIVEKQQYGQVSHGDGKLGPNYINDWFQDPAGFLAEMVKQGLLVPGDPDHSPFFRMLSFDGPMYKVFSDAEIELWKDYVRSLKP